MAFRPLTARSMVFDIYALGLVYGSRLRRIGLMIGFVVALALKLE